MKKMKILILGHRGMAGHVIYSYLKRFREFEVSNPDDLLGIKFDITKDLGWLERKLKESPFDYILNCVGLLIKKCEEDPVAAIKVNSLAPHELARLGDKTDTRIIHLSTDCYKDENVYGRSKRAGEINRPPHLTLRTSIIGPELKQNGSGLFEWFMRQEGEIRGYTNVFWDGVTTLELAKFIQWYLTNQNKLVGIKNLRHPTKISKYELLNLIKEVYGREIKIKPFEKISEDKTEENEFLDYQFPSYLEMIKELSKVD